jgi:WXG100 family type VII secretion target
MYGLDVEVVKAYATELGTSAQQIHDVAQNLTSKLPPATDWAGPDADRFRQEWSTNYSPTLQKISEALEETQSLANDNAQQQEDVSR